MAFHKDGCLWLVIVGSSSTKPDFFNGYTENVNHLSWTSLERDQLLLRGRKEARNDHQQTWICSSAFLKTSPILFAKGQNWEPGTCPKLGKAESMGHGLGIDKNMWKMLELEQN